LAPQYTKDRNAYARIRTILRARSKEEEDKEADAGKLLFNLIPIIIESSTKWAMLKQFITVIVTIRNREYNERGLIFTTSPFSAILLFVVSSLIYDVYTGLLIIY